MAMHNLLPGVSRVAQRILALRLPSQTERLEAVVPKHISAVIVGLHGPVLTLLPGLFVPVVVAHIALRVDRNDGAMLSQPS